MRPALPAILALAIIAAPQGDAVGQSNAPQSADPKRQSSDTSCSTASDNPDQANLSDKLAQSKGVICPPQRLDPGIQKAPPASGTIKVIPPPGSPGGDPTVQPK